MNYDIAVFLLVWKLFSFSFHKVHKKHIYHEIKDFFIFRRMIANPRDKKCHIIYYFYFFIIISLLCCFLFVLDPDTADSLIGSPFALLAFMSTYVFIVKKLGPQLMEKRQPYNIKNIIIIYNVIQILINFKIMYEVSSNYNRIYYFRENINSDMSCISRI